MFPPVFFTPQLITYMFLRQHVTLKNNSCAGGGRKRYKPTKRGQNRLNRLIHTTSQGTAVVVSLLNPFFGIHVDFRKFFVDSIIDKVQNDPYWYFRRETYQTNRSLRSNASSIAFLEDWCDLS